jgi:hypothetical protein
MPVYSPDLKESWGDDSSGGAPSSLTRPLVQYFLSHPKIKFGRTRPSPQVIGALSSNMKRLNTIYSAAAIRRAVDRFYATKTANTHPQPGLAFCNRAFQDKLFEGATMDVQDDILVFIQNGFTRDDSLVLPWEAEADADIRMEFVSDPELNSLVRTYPDAVAAVLETWGPTLQGMDILWNVALPQFRWLSTGDTPVPSERMEDISQHFPKDFVSNKFRSRQTWPSISEAVRSSRGR